MRSDEGQSPSLFLAYDHQKETPIPFILFAMPSSQIIKDSMKNGLKAIQFLTKYFAAPPAQRNQQFHMGRFPNRQRAGGQYMSRFPAHVKVLYLNLNHLNLNHLNLNLFI